MSEIVLYFLHSTSVLSVHFLLNMILVDMKRISAKLYVSTMICSHNCLRGVISGDGPIGIMQISVSTLSMI